MTSFYEVLGVGYDASMSTIQKAYENLKHENSKFNFRKMEANAQKIELLKEIEQAFLIIGDPKKRSGYDTCITCKSFKIRHLHSPNRKKLHDHILAIPVTHLKHRCPNCLKHIRNFKSHFRSGCYFKFDTEKSTLLTEERKKYIRRDGINFIAGFEEGFKKGCKASAFHNHYWPSDILLSNILASRKSGPTRYIPPIPESRGLGQGSNFSNSQVIDKDKPETILGT